MSRRIVVKGYPQRIHLLHKTEEIMDKILDNSFLKTIYAQLEQANSNFLQNYPGESGERQPVHTVYGGAHLFTAGLAQKFGNLGMRSLETFGTNFAHFARVLQMPGYETLPTAAKAIEELAQKLGLESEKVRLEHNEAWLAYTVYNRVRAKLKDEPVEDFRIDFEDGYGNRSDDEENAHAIQAAEQVAEGMEQESLPPFIGIRIKPLTEELRQRAVSTLDIFLTKLSKLTNGKLPENFVVTIPKVTVPEQVKAIVSIFEEIENKTKIPKGALKVELMIETTQSIINKQGAFTIPTLIVSGKTRVRGCHFGTYDYTASCNITASHQSISHPVCDFARNVMQVSLANTGVTISDGATTIMPIAPHREPKNGPPLTHEQKEENKKVVHNAWRLHYKNIMNSLLFGFYQGWDLNPAQLPIRYATMYTFFLGGLDQATKRLQAFIREAAKATLVGNTFDDAATGQGLLNYFLRALSCRALMMEEVLNVGLEPEEIKSRSFVKILANQREK